MGRHCLILSRQTSYQWERNCFCYFHFLINQTVRSWCLADSCLSVLMPEKLPLNTTLVQWGRLISATVLCSSASWTDADWVHEGLPSAQRGKNQYQARLFHLLHYSVMNVLSLTFRPNRGYPCGSPPTRCEKRDDGCDRNKHILSVSRCYFEGLLLFRRLNIFIGAASQRELTACH